MGFKLAIRSRYDFCQRFLLRLSKLPSKEYGVRVWSQISKRKISVGASSDSRAQSRSRPAKNIQEHHPESSVFSTVLLLYVIPENFRYGIMEVLQFRHYCLESRVGNSRKNSLVECCSCAFMIYDCLVPVPVINIFDISEKEYGLSSNILHGIINGPTTLFPAQFE
jgi:hypothetical protein